MPVASSTTSDVHFQSLEVAWSLFARWRVCARWTRSAIRYEPRSFWPGRCKRIGRVELVWCFDCLIVLNCVCSIILFICVLSYFYNQNNKIWRLIIPFVRLTVNPASRQEGDVTIVLSFIVLCCIEKKVPARNLPLTEVCCNNCFVTDYVKWFDTFSVM